jgi:hypothetical protein
MIFQFHAHKIDPDIENNITELVYLAQIFVSNALYTPHALSAYIFQCGCFYRSIKQRNSADDSISKGNHTGAV